MGEKIKTDEPKSFGKNLNFPRFRWEENDEEFLCYVPVPGYDKNSLEVNFENGFIIVHGDSEVFTVCVSLVLPSKVHPDDIYCELENGLLTIHFPVKGASTSKRSLL